jgi:hypothetical protein
VTEITKIRLTMRCSAYEDCQAAARGPAGWAFLVHRGKGLFHLRVEDPREETSSQGGGGAGRLRGRVVPGGECPAGRASVLRAPVRAGPAHQLLFGQPRDGTPQMSCATGSRGGTTPHLTHGPANRPLCSAGQGSTLRPNWFQPER